MKKTTMKIAALILSLIITVICAAPAAFAADTQAVESDSVITFTESAASVTSGSPEGVSVSGTDVKITAAGAYTFTGSCSSGTITVKKNVTGVTLILDGLTLGATATAPITCNKGSQVTIFAADGSVNTLSDDEYNNDDIYTDADAYPDIENAVIKCKDGSNVTLCGTGALNIDSYGKNGIKGGYDLYEEDSDGNVTDTLLSTASLTIKDLTLNVTANVNDGIKSDKELNILSGNITVSAADDGIKSDYTLNIGAEGTDGPSVTVSKSNEGIEAATLNVYSGNITVNATDDGINAANSDLTNYSFSYNQYGGFVYVNCQNGDGIDSNGSVNLTGGTLEVFSPSQGDGDPIDSDKGIVLGGATVLAAGHNAMMQSYTASTPYVVFGASSSGMGAGGMGPGRNSANSVSSETEAFGFGNSGTTLVKAGSAIAVKDSSGNTLYSSTAVRDASYVLFASPSLKSGSSYTLYSGSSSVAASAAGSASSAGNQGGFPGQQGGNVLPGSTDNSGNTENTDGSSAFSGILSFFGNVISWFSRIVNWIVGLFA